MALMRHPWAVRSLVVHHEAEGPVPVPDLEPLEAQVGDDVGGIALDNTLAVRTVHDGVHVGPLTRKDAPVIEPPRSGLRRDAQVPLPEDRGLVPRSPQHLGVRRHPVVQLRVDGAGAVDVAVGAGEMVALDGVQIELVQNTLSRRAPSWAIRSMLGVWFTALP